jgi:hypothetical protein
MGQGWAAWRKIVRTMAPTVSWAALGTTESKFLMKWTRHRCQEAPENTLPIAWRRPSWGRR